MAFSAEQCLNAGEALAPPTQCSGQGVGMASQDAFDPRTFLAYIGAGRTIASYRQQSPICAQGDVADTVFYIHRGQVKLTVVSARGKEAVIALLEAQAFFGEGCLAGQPRRIAAATAHTDCALMRIE